MVVLHLGSGTYFRLTGVAIRAWALLQDPTTLNDIQTALAAEYDVAPSRLDRDTRALVDELLAARLIDVVPAATE